MENKVQIVGKNQGKQLKIAGGNYRIIVSGDDTDRQYSIIEMNVPPGGGPNPHRHQGFEETFFVLEGEVEFSSEDGKSTATVGDLIRIPLNGGAHCFKNKSDKPAKLLCTVVPSGLDEFFEKADQAAKDEPENMAARMKELSETYGQQLLPPDYFDTAK
ncbi:MAG: cupin domain-containing protein [Flavobacterium sp.]|uniref:cupin domain-containing protein n=1 Tax=Flavobacterium sp. TaxID=239 RepID=UPI00121364CC|nr:cupin domain-containing protein [Flavobacterium sp.]RZJ65136.1 MAG: cupin domain-containing protein [Flavobacterium sp.]